MLRDQSPLIQCLLGTGFTWLVTAAGAALVFVFHSPNQRLLDYSLGFGAGVMTAASFWSLLDPAFKIAHEQTYLTEQLNIFLIMLGFALGAIFVYMADLLLPSLSSKQVFQVISHEKKKEDPKGNSQKNTETPIRSAKSTDYTVINRSQGNSGHDSSRCQIGDDLAEEKISSTQDRARWHRLVLLIIAVTVHNFPEGMAVGVGFGSIPTSNNATSSFNHARNLAVGIGIQNFPEGLAISLPLRSFGIGRFKAFWYGQLSGLVEVVAGVLGVFFVQLAHSLLPFALSFAAGAMLFVVFNEIIPEISPQNRTIASWWVMGGFMIMMMLDVLFS